MLQIVKAPWYVVCSFVTMSVQSILWLSLFFAIMIDCFRAHQSAGWRNLTHVSACKNGCLHEQYRTNVLFSCYGLMAETCCTSAVFSVIILNSYSHPDLVMWSIFLIELLSCKLSSRLRFIPCLHIVIRCSTGKMSSCRFLRSLIVNLGFCISLGSVTGDLQKHSSYHSCKHSNNNSIWLWSHCMVYQTSKYIADIELKCSNWSCVVYRDCQPVRTQTNESMAGLIRVCGRPRFNTMSVTKIGFWSQCPSEFAMVWLLFL